MAVVQHWNRELRLRAAVFHLYDQMRAKHLKVGPQFSDGCGWDANGIIFLWVFVGVKAFVVDEDKAFVPSFSVLGALVDDTLVEDAISREAVSVFVVGLLKFAALLHHPSVD